MGAPGPNLLHNEVMYDKEKYVLNGSSNGGNVPS